MFTCPANIKNLCACWISCSHVKISTIFFWCFFSVHNLSFLCHESSHSVSFSMSILILLRSLSFSIILRFVFLELYITALFIKCNRNISMELSWETPLLPVWEVAIQRLPLFIPFANFITLLFIPFISWSNTFNICIWK